MRVVSLACSNTEIVCALGQGQLLVGVDDHSDFPLEVIGSLPRVGPDLQIDIARVEALKPDLVLASLTVPGHERVVSDLQRAGLPHVVLDPTSAADVARNVETIASLLGVPERGRALGQELAEQLAPRARTGKAPTVLIEWWPKPVIVPGQQSWVNEVLSAAGAANPFATRSCKSTPITDAEAVGADPDAIVISWCGIKLAKYRTEVVYRRPAWQHVRAIRERKVFRIPEAYLGRPGPRLALGAAALREIVEQLQ